MLSAKAGAYILHQHGWYKHPLEHVAAKWTAVYPDDAITVAEAEAFVKQAESLRNNGVEVGMDPTKVLEALARPKLTVITKKAPEKKIVKKRKER